MKQVEILFVTSTNLSTNPRCYKEIQLAIKNGYQVSLLAFTLPGWSRNFEKQYTSELGIKNFFYLSAERTPFFPWFLSSIIERVARILFMIHIRSSFINAMALSKRTFLLCQFLKKYKGLPQLVIAHNPPAFYPVHWFARRINTMYATDVEDYHPGEGENEQNKLIMTSLMKTILPGASYISFAAPLIQKQTIQLLGKYINKPLSVFTINNVFPASDFHFNDNPDIRRPHKIKLVWFSQNIGPDRGLESLLPVLDQFDQTIELTLIGNAILSFTDEWIKPRPYINILPSMHSLGLYKSLSQYDIGLAIETEKEENRKYCLANKIWAYFQSGLFILATNTLAQNQFLKEHPNHGILCAGNSESYAQSLNWIKNHMLIIQNEKWERFYSARQMGWENERIKLQSKWKEILEN